MSAGKSGMGVTDEVIEGDVFGFCVRKGVLVAVEFTISDKVINGDAVDFCIRDVVFIAVGFTTSVELLFGDNIDCVKLLVQPNSRVVKNNIMIRCLPSFEVIRHLQTPYYLSLFEYISINLYNNKSGVKSS